MGTITHLHERIRSTPLRHATEASALETATAIAADIPASPRLVREDLARAGLLALGIPSDFAGLDAANAVIADVIGIIARHAPAAAGVLVRHYAGLEALRHCGSEEQRRLLFGRIAAGESVALVRDSNVGGSDRPADPAGLAAAPDIPSIEAGTPLATLSRDGVGYRLRLALVEDPWQVADWGLVWSRTEDGALGLALFRWADAGPMSDAAPGVGVGARWRCFDVHIAADCVLAWHSGADAMGLAMEQFLQAASVLGRARPWVTERLARCKAASSEPAGAGLEPRRAIRPSPTAQAVSGIIKSSSSIPVSSSGNLTPVETLAMAEAYLDIESLAAVMDRAATALDLAQVGPCQTSIGAAVLATTVVEAAMDRVECRFLGKEREVDDRPAAADRVVPSGLSRLAGRLLDETNTTKGGIGSR